MVHIFEITDSIRFPIKITLESIVYTIIGRTT